MLPNFRQRRWGRANCCGVSKMKEGKSILILCIVHSTRFGLRHNSPIMSARLKTFNSNSSSSSSKGEPIVKVSRQGNDVKEPTSCSSSYNSRCLSCLAYRRRRRRRRLGFSEGKWIRCNDARVQADFDAGKVEMDGGPQCGSGQRDIGLCIAGVYKEHRGRVRRRRRARRNTLEEDFRRYFGG